MVESSRGGGVRTRNGYHPATSVIRWAKGVPSLVDSVEFHGIGRTKFEALVKEVSGLYASDNLDKLVRNSHFACVHMQEVGLFETCRALIDTAPSTSEPSKYRVNFVVKEHPSFTLGANMGVTTTADADLTFNATKKNIGGMAESVGVAYSRTLKGGHSFDFTLNKPFLGWAKHSNVGVSSYRSFQNLRWNKANVMENALIFGYNGPLFSDKLQHNLRLNLIWRHFLPTSQAAFPVREHAGHTSKISFEHAVTLADTRDRPLLPSRGGLIKVASELAGLFGDAAFIRHQLDLQAAAPLLYGFFVGASLRAVAINSIGDRSLHLLDRVYLGGPYDIRGFGLNSIGTRIDGCGLGGSAGYAAALHLYKSLIPHDMLFAHAFLSSGSVASVRSRNWMRSLSDTPRLSAGLGLTFVFNNMIRLELNYVLPLKQVPGDACSTGGGVQFGAGINFL